MHERAGGARSSRSTGGPTLESGRYESRFTEPGTHVPDVPVSTHVTVTNAIRQDRFAPRLPGGVFHFRTHVFSASCSSGRVTFDVRVTRPGTTIRPDREIHHGNQ